MYSIFTLYLSDFTLLYVHWSLGSLSIVLNVKKMYDVKKDVRRTEKL